MSRFYTHVRNGAAFSKDDEGQDFANLDEARQSALASAGQMISDEIAAGRYRISLELYVHDEAGRPLETHPVTAMVSGLDDVRTPGHEHQA